MPDVDNNLEGMHQELRDLATAIMRQDPPLDQRAKAIAEALVMAIWRRGRPRELLHHSDRGSQHTRRRSSG